MPVPRFRLRTLMIAVAVVAVVLGGGPEAVRLVRGERGGLTQTSAHDEDELAASVKNSPDEKTAPFDDGPHPRLPGDPARVDRHRCDRAADQSREGESYG